MTQDQMKKITALSYYLSKLKKAYGDNITNAIPQDCDYDYHEILSKVEDQVNKGLESLKENDEDTSWYYPLEKIDIERDDYEVIVRQIYDKGIKYKYVFWEPKPPVPSNNLAECFTRYTNSIPGGVSTRTTIEAIVSRMNNLCKKQINGLVVGRVQSGKTQNFTGLVLKAISENWNMIVILTSDNTALAAQTRERLSASFGSVGITDANCRELDFLSQSKMPPQINIPDNSNYFYWGVAMKESHSLDRIIACLDKVKADGNIKKINLLVIDDEADNATPNSAAGKDVFNDDKINEYLNLLREEDQDEIADWLANLKDLDMPEDKEEQTKEQQIFLGELKKCNGKNLFAFLSEWSEFLQLSYLDEDDKEVDVYGNIEKYYTAPKGDTANSRTLLITVLKSIFDLVTSKSTINRKICHVISTDTDKTVSSYDFQKCAYIGYTATPYACVFNERPEQTPIYPDFIYSLSKGQGYFGLDEIFGKQQPITPIPKMPIIHSITEDEMNKILAPLRKEDNQLKIAADLTATFAGNKYEWTSFQKMIKWAFCAAAARSYFRLQKLQKPDLTDKERKKLEDISERWTSMLVNIAPKQIIHKKIKKHIIDFLTLKCANKDQFVEECLAVWNEMTQETYLTEEKFRELFPEYENFTTYPAEKDIRNGLEDFIKNCRPDKYVTTRVHVIEINSTANGKNSQCEYIQAEKYDATEKDEERNVKKNESVVKLTQDHLWIISGGNTISRGLTLPGLVSSYFDRIRKSVAIDTMTQMGRWFGYRRGYELLPRLAMDGSSIEEVKKVAVIEDKMHQEIEEKFTQNISPSDPTGYLTIYTCGRKLSGRQKALKVSGKSVSTMSSTNQFYMCDENIAQIHKETDRFLKNTKSYRKVRDEETYQYSAYDLRTDIPANKICEYLGKIKDFYPTASKLKLEALQNEIAHPEYMHVNWSVVVGEPEERRNSISFDLGERSYRAGNPQGDIFEGIATYSNTRLHLPYHAMIPYSELKKADLKFIEENQKTILKKISENPTGDIDAVLLPGDTITDRLKKTIEHYKGNDKRLPNSLHGLLNYVSTGYRNRSADKYLEEVHKDTPYNSPILQIYLINTPDGILTNGLPVISVAFYWPGHNPAGFVAASLGMPEDFLRPTNTISAESFYTTVKNLLAETNFPMPVANLRAIVCKQLGCDESYFSQRINKDDEKKQYGYESVDGKDAYCIAGWAEGTTYIERLDKEFYKAAYATLVESSEELQTLELIQETIRRESQFEGLYNPQLATVRSKFNTGFNNMIETEGWAIRKPSLRPVTYIFDAEMEQGE